MMIDTQRNTLIRVARCKAHLKDVQSYNENSLEKKQELLWRLSNVKLDFD